MEDDFDQIDAEIDDAIAADDDDEDARRIREALGGSLGAVTFVGAVLGSSGLGGGGGGEDDDPTLPYTKTKASIAQAPNPGTVADHFTDPLPGRWVDSYGSWDVTGSLEVTAIEASITQPKAQLVNVELGEFADGEASIEPVLNNMCGIIARWNRETRTGYFIVRTNATTAQLRFNAGSGAPTILNTFAIVAGDRIGCRCTSDTIEALVNGVSVFSTSHSGSASGWWGVGGNSVGTTLDFFEGERA